MAHEIAAGVIKIVFKILLTAPINHFLSEMRFMDLLYLPLNS